MFIRDHSIFLEVHQRYFQPIRLPITTFKSHRKFLSVDFHFKSFLVQCLLYSHPDEISIVSRYCQKFLIVRRICLYCKNGAFKKTICSSGAPMFVTFFLDLSNFFIPVSSVKRIIMSIFVGKLNFLMSEKYFSAILYMHYRFVLQTLQFYY